MGAIIIATTTPFVPCSPIINVFNQQFSFFAVGLAGNDVENACRMRKFGVRF